MNINNLIAFCQSEVDNKNKNLDINNKSILTLSLTGLVLKHGIDKMPVIIREYKNINLYMSNLSLKELNEKESLHLKKDLVDTTDSVFIINVTDNMIKASIAITNTSERESNDLLGATIHELNHAISNNSSLVKTENSMILSHNLTTLEKNNKHKKIKNHVYEEMITSLMTKEILNILMKIDVKLIENDNIKNILNQLKHVTNIDEISGYPNYSWLIEDLYNNKKYQESLEKELLGKEEKSIYSLMLKNKSKTKYNKMLKIIDKIDLEEPYYYKDYLSEIKNSSKELSDKLQRIRRKK